MDGLNEAAFFTLNSLHWEHGMPLKNDKEEGNLQDGNLHSMKERSNSLFFSFSLLARNCEIRE